MTDSIVRYAEYSEQAFDEDVNRANAIGGTAIMDLKQGENVVRFIPSKEPGVSPLRTTGMHFVDTVPGLDKVAVFACPKKELMQPCPVCDAAAQLMRSPNPIDRERGEKISVKLTIYANVIDRSAPADDPNYGVRVLKFGKAILEQLKTIRRSTRTGGDFFNPGPTGFDIVIFREGEKMSTRYKVVPDRTNGPIYAETELAQAVIDNAYDLNAYVNPVVPEQVANYLMSSRGYQASAEPARAALPAGSRAPYTRPAPPAAAAAPKPQSVGAGLFGEPVSSASQTVADADFSEDEDDDFGPPKAG
jgi:hypothetical protein